ncbi:MAG: hypothetical protein P8Q36_02035 [Alphaproteobacteria bacterium]|jgi:hypothetical protein|nr:hypothetical protein [Rhodospirillaceae bacterium]MDG2479633.1 hypothetical protein [Alphaproteobacteria bacterium]MBT6202131.1 hypothetical protein [Rhodospirillaceae bacterium]MBT6513077.1 hypothetical protein [Rhodospirillaceae bacterium]MBT7612700.1 hypothetical protein [Rhodospirillaceae bacterium]
MKDELERELTALTPAMRTVMSSKMGPEASDSAMTGPGGCDHTQVKFCGVIQPDLTH